MSVSTIEIEVDDETANRYSAMSRADRRKLGLLLGIQLQEFERQPQRTIAQVMDEMAATAVANGLTPEKLQALLDDE